MIQTFAGRPSVLNIGGTTIFLSVHDAEFMRQWRIWRHRLAQAHPDGGGSSYKFRRALSKYQHWQFQQAEFYQAVGVEPPKVLPEPKSFSGQILVIPDVRPCEWCHAKPIAEGRAQFCSAICFRASKKAKSYDGK